MPKGTGARHATPLSSALRKFYLKVHPDLFTGHPKEQEKNEASFKILTEYLENYKQEAESTSPYSLEFYVRVLGEGGSTTLKRVIATLLLPSRHSSAEAREHILKNNLSKLFRQCDYHDEIDVAGYGSSNKKLRSAGANEVSLVSILMAASLRFKPGGPVGRKTTAQAELDAAKEKLKAANAKLQEALAKNYGIKFGIEVPAIHFKTPLERLQLIKKWLDNVQSSFDELKVTGHKMELLKGKTIHFGYKKQGPTNAEQPNLIYLEINEPRSSWVDTLREINPTADAALREKLEKKTRMEIETAAALGVKRIEASTDVALRNLDQYLTVLQRLHMHAIAKPHEWNQLHPSRNRISIRCVERIDGVFQSELASGTILFPVSRNVSDLHQLLTEYAPQLVAENTEFEKAVNHLKERYGLAQLAVKPDLSSENIVECLNRLIDGHHVLRQYLTGVNLCVSDEYAANEDSKIVFVKYDFLY